MNEKSSPQQSPEPEPEPKRQKDTEPTDNGEGYYSGVDSPDAATDDTGS
jgi:hypothetical protein